MHHPLAEGLRVTMRRWPSGVSVVTASHGGARAGITVSSFISVSLNPPRVLVSIEEGTDAMNRIREAKAFAVSVLGEGADEVSSRFAGFGRGGPHADRFEGSPTSPRVTGAPVLDDAIAWVDCRLHATHPVGTHVLVIGEVVASGVSAVPAKPLVYCDRAYHRLA